MDNYKPLITTIVVVSLSLICGCNNSSGIISSDDDSLEFSATSLTLNDAEEDVGYSIDLNDYLSEVDSSELSYGMSEAPTWLSLESSGYLSGTPSEDDIGEYSWQVEVSDGETSATATLNLTVRSSEWFQVLALADLTDAPTVYDINGDEYSIDTESGEIQEIYYQVLDYQGSETRAFAYVGIPADVETPVPAMVLVHGGGGTAYSDWVEEWMDRGYAAISMSVEGEDGDGETTDWAGPSRDGIYNDANPERASFYVDVPDQWMYHAVADTILANSLMRSIDVIDQDKVGLMGISWGGVITSTVMGIDDRFALAIPVYGCGHLYDADNWWSNTLSYNSLYQSVWDPMTRLDKAGMPSLWLSWSDDNNFGMDSFGYSYEAAAGDHMVSLIPDMGHSHASAWRPSDSYEFADSIFNEGSAWFKQISLSQDAAPGDEVSMVFTSSKTLTSYSLRYTTGTGFTGDLDWLDESASLSENSDGSFTLTATLPEGTTGWYFSLSDDDVYVSSDYTEIVELIVSPDEEVVLTVASGESIASAQIELSFTGPTNIDIQSLEFSDFSTAFSTDPEPEIELNIEYPTETLTVSFDNSIAELAAGESVSTALTFSWETLDGGSKSLVLPVQILIAE